MTARVEYEFEFQSVGIGEENCVVVRWVIQRWRVKNHGADFLQQPVETVNLSSAVSPECQMVQTRRIAIMLSLSPLRSRHVQKNSGGIVVARIEAELLRGVFAHPVTEMLHHRLIETLCRCEVSGGQVDVMDRPRHIVLTDGAYFRGAGIDAIFDAISCARLPNAVLIAATTAVVPADAAVVVKVESVT